MRTLDVGNMYPPHSLGGYEAMWHASVQHRRARGDDVRVLASNFHDPAAAGRADDPAVHRDLRWYWRDYEFPSYYPHTVGRIERHNRRVLRRHLEELEPDTVAFWSMGGMSLSLITEVRRSGVPAIGVVGDGWLVYGTIYDRWLRWNKERPLLARLADPFGRLGRPGTVLDEAHWIFISRWLMDDARSKRPLVPESEIAHPGIDPDRWSPGEPREWSWKLLSAGRLDRRKGLDDMIDALARLPTETTLRLDGGGDGDYGEELADRATRLGVTGRLTIDRSPRDALAAAYRAADAVLFCPVWQEPWGLVPIEAMACGTPVIATGTGGSAEFLEDGVNSILVPSEDPAAIAAAVERLAADPALRARLRAGGLETAERFTDRHFNDQVAAALDRVRKATR